MSSTTATRLSIIVSIFAAATTVVLGWTSVRGLDTLWDEQVDHDIAIGLLEHPLTGESPTLDASQTRLPMYVNAIAYALTGRDDLAVSRGVSLVFAAITVIVAASLGRLLFGPWVGALAAVLLALSPYFLSFARIAMTEGDIFFACFVTLAVRGFVRYLQRPTASRWVWAAVLLGLAMGAKVFAGFLVLVFGVLAMTTGPSRSVEFLSRRYEVQRLQRLLGAGVMVILVTGGLAMLSNTPWAAVAGWIVLLALWCVTIAFVLRKRALAPGRGARFVGMVVLAVVTFFAVMPVHLIEHDIARTILRRAFQWDDAAPLAVWSDHIRLYAGIILIKLSVPFGILTAGALVFAAIRGRDDPRWRPCILAIAVCVVCLCLLPLRQSFYLMGVYPLIMILVAAFMVHIGHWLRGFSREARTAWTVAVVCLLAYLGREAYVVHPHYSLYGYGLIGDRWLGAESRGYRNLIQTPSDGVESLIRWCNAHPDVVRPGARVVSYLWEEAIIGQVLPEEPWYVFVPRGISQASDAVPPPPAIDEADFVLLHINNRLGYGDRPPDWPLGTVLQDGFEVVHTVWRGPLEVAWIYGRRGEGDAIIPVK